MYTCLILYFLYFENVLIYSQMSSWRKEDCAECKIRTDSSKYVKYRRRVSNSIKEFITSLQPWSSNNYICHICYQRLIKLSRTFN